jgi:hypothetical protein
VASHERTTAGPGKHHVASFNTRETPARRG